MITAEERLKQVKPKFGRAKEHLTELQSELRKFLDSNPYIIGCRRDAQDRPEYFLESVRPVPTRIALIAGDAIQNVVSGLDHFAFQLVLRYTNEQPKKPAKVYFPLALTEQRFEEKLADLEGLPDKVRDAIRALKPYRGGNDQLWRLQVVNNIEKHRLLLTVGSQNTGVDVGAAVAQGAVGESEGDACMKKALASFSFWLRPADTGMPLQAGHVIFIDSPGEPLNKTFNCRFSVGIDEPGADLRHDDLLVAVGELHNEAMKAIDALKVWLE